MSKSTALADVPPKRWQDITDDPDNPQAWQWREARVTRTAMKPLARYEDIIARYLAGVTVLDFGAANHTTRTGTITGESTHELVARYGASVIAVDVAAFHARRHEKCTYVTANLLNEEEREAVKLDLVDVFFAGHVIEHLDSPSDLYKLAARMLRPGGRLIVVTPNPLWLPGLWARAAYRNLSVNVDHVSLFGASELMELGERHSFELIEWAYAGKDDMPRVFEPPAPPRRLTRWAYRLARRRNLAFAHNSILAAYVLGADSTASSGQVENPGASRPHMRAIE